MNCAGIISEFNPFHTGHKHLIDSIREKGSDAVVCVMSGDFVQRGAPAMWDKYIRARAAIEGGADLVLELPAVYAVSGAGQFARGGVGILKALGCVDHIAFGSESGNGEMLMDAAALLAKEPEAFSQAIREALAEGLSYPSAYSRAAGSIGLDESLFTGANDILALEYLKQNFILEAGLKPVAIKRQGAGHDSNFTLDGFASASYLRKKVSEAFEHNIDYVDLSDISNYILPNALKDIKESPHFDKFAEDRYFRVIQHMLLTEDPEIIAEAADISEGFENVLIREAWGARDLNDLISSAKIKRFTYARISRILCQLFLGITKELEQSCLEDDIYYAKVLAFNDTGARLLSQIRESSDVPVISNSNKDRKNHPQVRRMLDLDIRASELYSMIMGGSPKDLSDLTCIPKPCNI